MRSSSAGIRRSYTAEQGYMEAATWVESNFPNPGAIKDWLKGRRPDLYDKLFPKARDLSPRLVEVQQKFMLPKHRQGHPGLPHQASRGARHLLGQGRRHVPAPEPAPDGGQVPGAVRRRQPLGRDERARHLSRRRLAARRGSADGAAGARRQADGQGSRRYRRLRRTSGRSRRSTGRAASTSAATSTCSRIRRPAGSATRWWTTRRSRRNGCPREPLAIIHGTIAGTTNHTGFFPRWEVVFNDNGYISEVKGGGIIGDALREFMQLPTSTTSSIRSTTPSTRATGTCTRSRSARIPRRSAILRAWTTAR